MLRPGLFAILGLTCACAVAAQDLGSVTVQAFAVPVEQIRVADLDPTNFENAPILLTITVLNDDQPRPLVLEVDVFAGRYGLLGTARTDLGALAPHAVAVVTNRDADTYDITPAARDLLEETLQAGLLPADTYTYHVRVLQNGLLIADDEADVETTNPATGLEIFGPGTVLDVTDTPEVVANPFPVFQWASNARRFDLAVYEVLETHTSADDVVAARPVFVQRDIEDQLFVYPTYAELLDGVYAWQLTARVQTALGVQLYPSEVYWFRVDQPGGAGREDAGARTQIGQIDVQPAQGTVVPGAVLPFQATVYDAEGEILPLSVQWRVIPASAGEMGATGLFMAGAEAHPAVAVVAEVGDVSGHALVTIETPPSAPPAGPRLTLLTPVDAGVIQQPNPSFTWQAEEVEDAAQQTYRVTVWPAAADGTGAPSAPPLWSRTISGLSLGYPLDAPALSDQQSYVARVGLLDAQGSETLTSPPVTFAMAREPKVDYALFQEWSRALLSGRGDEAVRLTIELQAPGLTTEQAQQLRGAGASVEEVFGVWAQVTVPFARLSEVAALDLARHLLLPAPHHSFGGGPAVRQPPAAPRPNAHLLFGLPAEPSAPPLVMPPLAEVPRVALFEFGFDRAAIERMVQGPAPTFYSFRQDEQIGGGSPAEALHGTATAGALLEVLPQAELHLFNFDTELEFLQALEYAVERLGVRVLSCSVSWMQAYDHYDGSSFFAREVDRLLGDDVVLVTAAGNFGRSHWEATFTDADGDGLHEFAPGVEALRLGLRSGVAYEFLLSWDDWDGIETDLDLDLLDGAGARIYDPYGQPYRSANRQGRGQFERPVEQIRGFISPFPGTQTYLLQIQAAYVRRGRRPHLELYIYPPPVSASPEAIPESSLAGGLATAHSTLPVTAVDFAEGSRGPTNDDRPRPYFAADGIVQVAGTRQQGTSFAAPRVAAAFALTFAARPSWSREQATTYLRQFVPTPGDHDNRYGWGALDLGRLAPSLRGPASR